MMYQQKENIPTGNTEIGITQKKKKPEIIKITSREKQTKVI